MQRNRTGFKPAKLPALAAVLAGLGVVR